MVGKKLKQLIEQKGVSVPELEGLSKVSRSTIYDIINEKRKPSLATIKALVLPLGVESKYVLENTQESKTMTVADREYLEFAKRRPDLTILSDHPLRIDDCSTETFDLRWKVGPVYDIIRHEDTKTPMAILITGDWGTGKTSAMRWLHSLLDVWNNSVGPNDFKVHPVWFYPWKYDNKQDVWRGLIWEAIMGTIDTRGATLEDIRYAAERLGPYLGRSFLNTLASIRLKHETSTSAKGVDFDLTELGRTITALQDVTDLERAHLSDFENELRSWVKKVLHPRERMIIFIDDLDRCMPEIMLQVIQAMHLYLNIEKLIFIVGVDRKVVERLVIEHYAKLGLVKSEKEGKYEKKEQSSIRRREEAKAIQYISKMFQVEVQLEPTERQISKFFDEQLNKLKYWNEDYLSMDEQQLFRDLVLKFAGRNPREVKRLLNSALIKGAGSVMINAGRINFAQGLQLFFVRKILDEKYTMASEAGSNRGIEFFVQWSRIVCKAKEEDEKFPLTVKVPTDFIKSISQISEEFASASNVEGKGNPELVEDFLNKAKIDKLDLSFAELEYHELLQNPRFFVLLYLLADEDLGRLMQIQYPADADEIAVVIGTTKNSDIIDEAVARQLDKKPDELTDDDYKNTKELNLNDSGISNLELLRKLTNIEKLKVSWNTVTNLEPLKCLKNLKELEFYGAPVQDLEPISGLKSLEKLVLSDTQVEKLDSIVKLTNLQRLSFSKTNITDLRPLKGLTKLQWLEFDQVHVIDLGSLGGLKNLRSLYLSGTQVSDIGALSGLTKLERLYLRDTRVSDIGALSGLTKLEWLYLRSTQISDIGSISGLTKLERLELSETQVSDIDVLLGLTNLQEVYLDDTPVGDVDVLSGLTNLRELYLNGTQVSDIGALSGLTKLERLELRGVQVSDVGALSALTKLEQLELSETQVSDIGILSGFTNLEKLYLYNTQVGDEQVAELKKALPKLRIIR